MNKFSSSGYLNKKGVTLKDIFIMEKNIFHSNKKQTSHWKWGFIYYNPDNPAVFVENKSGDGYTFNMGQWLSYVLLAIFIIPVLLILLYC